MNILKLNVAVFSSLLFLLFAVVDTAAGGDYADGKLGKALILDGSSHTVKIPHYAGLKPAKAITISAWIKPERVGKGGWQWQQIYRKEDGSSKVVTIWCSNDYLGMGQNPTVLEAAAEALETSGAGAGGTRNISGTTYYHVELEKSLADLHQKEAGLVFSSGYVANEGALGTLGKLFPDCVIFSDALNHASMIEGVRRNGGAKRIFRHNDVEHLRALMAADDPAAPKLIAFESIYSMDGDFGPALIFPIRVSAVQLD